MAVEQHRVGASDAASRAPAGRTRRPSSSRTPSRRRPAPRGSEAARARGASRGAAAPARRSVGARPVECLRPPAARPRGRAGVLGAPGRRPGVFVVAFGRSSAAEESVGSLAIAHAGQARDERAADRTPRRSATRHAGRYGIGGGRREGPRAHLMARMSAAPRPSRRRPSGPQRGRLAARGGLAERQLGRRAARCA